MTRNCLLLYFTGTYNTRHLSHWLRRELESAGYTVTEHEIDPSHLYRLDFSPYDLLGLGYPIHGYAAPWAFLRFVRHQQFPKGLQTFIFKNSGETELANDASSQYLLRKMRRCGIRVDNEYHFLMPYNIHFRFDDRLVKEMLQVDAKLMRILVHEVTHHIPNRRRPGLWPRLVCRVVSPLQYIAGDVNSFLYKVHPERCTGCGLCVQTCPMHNIECDADGRIHFHHHCLMCMRCSFFCPANAIDIGFIQGWKVNGRYHFDTIQKLPDQGPYITDQTKGFFACYKRTYNDIEQQYRHYFDAENK